MDWLLVYSATLTGIKQFNNSSNKKDNSSMPTKNYIRLYNPGVTYVISVKLLLLCCFATKHYQIVNLID